MDLRRAPHHPVPAVTTLICAGEIDSTGWQDFREQIIGCASVPGTSTVILDLADVTFFDSSAIRAIIGARQALQDSGVSLHIDRASRMVTKVLQVTGLGGFVTRSDNRDESRGPAAAI